MALKKLPRKRHLKKVVKSPLSKNEVKTVDALKKKYRHLPLHFLFGIEKEIEHQCPSLDQYLEQLEEVKTTLEKIRRCQSLEVAKIHAAEGLYFINQLPKAIDENTRGNFEQLRSTMEQWKQLAIKAINDSGEVEKYLNIK